MQASAAAGRAARPASPGGACRRARSACRPGTRSLPATGRSSRAKRALRRLSRPSQVVAEPVRPSRVGSTQSNMSMPAPITRQDALGVADAHEVARPRGGQQGGRGGRDVEHQLALLAHAAARRSHSRRTARAVSWPAERARSARSVPPWTIPKRSWPSGRGARDAVLGPARRALDRALEVGPGARGGHSSNAIAMSDPSVRLDRHRELGREARRGAVVAASGT